MFNLIKQSAFKSLQFQEFRQVVHPSLVFLQVVNRSSTMKRSVKEEIILNDQESKIRDVLVDYCNFYNSQDNGKGQLELRITGGWVRDKLLGRESNDIDIAVNHLTGEDFASQLLDYLKTHRNDLTLKSLHTIKSNPEKSKHLETCTARLFDMDIDFVNLRSEEYSKESRVPIIKFGTAEEDALRRDATLNALFYNLNHSKIEDFTGKGFDDLKNGILRTPLAPLQTFLDDPLRVLRLIRFASRFDFIVETETLESMKNPEIRSALASKISKERLDVELEKIFKSDNPIYGLKLINYTNLTDSLFGPDILIKEATKAKDTNGIQKSEAAGALLEAHLDKVNAMYPVFKTIIENNIPNESKFKQLFTNVTNNSEYQKPFWLALILFPYHSVSLNLNPKKQLEHAIKLIMRESLKAKKLDMDIVTTINKQYDTSRNVLERYFTEPESIKRSELGLYLKEFSDFSDLNILFNAFIEVSQQYHTQTASAPSPIPEDITNDSIKSLILHTADKYERLLHTIEAQSLENVHHLRPLLDGTTLSKEFKTRPGPWIKKISDEIFIWQLDNPTKDKQDCMEYVKGIIDKYI
ncbi:hypothetical protein DFJ63DRAFT_282872 [Scheffersomyces coipomensis]|uniref:uncharacterized protein n=1 Tax=Scheffersomyces coipomensis TaxID=1788519 RepID=UPI00315DB2C2